VKVCDLVRFCNGSHIDGRLAYHRKKGIILSFDEDNDPMVLWFDSSFHGQPEANFRRHIAVLSEC
jgi:hypothetical protein